MQMTKNMHFGYDNAENCEKIKKMRVFLSFCLKYFSKALAKIPILVYYI